jgi:hypothetical protein
MHRSSAADLGRARYTDRRCTLAARGRPTLCTGCHRACAGWAGLGGGSRRHVGTEPGPDAAGCCTRIVNGPLITQGKARPRTGRGARVRPRVGIATAAARGAGDPDGPLASIGTGRGPAVAGRCKLIVIRPVTAVNRTCTWANRGRQPPGPATTGARKAGDPGGPVGSVEAGRQTGCGGQISKLLVIWPVTVTTTQVHGDVPAVRLPAGAATTCARGGSDPWRT